MDMKGLHDLQYHAGVAVKETCRELGFFRLVNHGIPIHLLQNVETIIRQLFDMPAEAKNRAATSSPVDSYYSKDFNESFCVSHSDSVQEMSDKIWPQGNPKFCETIQSYMFYLSDLTSRLSKILLPGLDLYVETFYRSDFEKHGSQLRIHHYISSPGKFIDEEVLFPHTDLCSFTILYQDNVGGLQIRSKGDKWLNVKPLPHSFVINIGDSLKAWSNGRYRSAEHRVVYKGWNDRISFGYFVFFEEDKEIRAPSELVDDYHPRRYKPFTFRRLKQEYLRNLHSEGDKVSFIDQYSL